MPKDDRTIRLYYAYRATTSNGFWMPYGYVYLLEQDFGEAALGFANAAFLFAMVAAELPASSAWRRTRRCTR